MQNINPKIYVFKRFEEVDVDRQLPGNLVLVNICTVTKHRPTNKCEEQTARLTLVLRKQINNKRY